MPIFESACANRSCPNVGMTLEHYYPHHESPMAECESCGQRTARVQSRFAVVFTGPITARYNDKNAENPHQEGHYAWRRKSSKSGKPEATWIDSWQAQKDFCREEGLVNPREQPRNLEVAEDGKAVANTRGMPGTEI